MSKPEVILALLGILLIVAWWKSGKLANLWNAMI